MSTIKAQLSGISSFQNTENNSYQIKYLFNEEDDFGWEITDLFEEVENFKDGASILYLGIGFRSDIRLSENSQVTNNLDANAILPPIYIGIEKNIWNNIGLGLTFGYQFWKVPIFNYQYHYYLGSFRATYHFNVLEKLDPYIGGAVSYRHLSLTNRKENIGEGKVTGTYLIGARYYPFEKLGFLFEIGNDIHAWFKFGISYNLSE